MTKYTCKNYGSCAKADAREPIELTPGSEAICECGFKLDPIEENSTGNPRKKKILFGGVALLVAIAGILTYLGLDSTSKPSTTSGVAMGANIESGKATTGLVPDEKVLSGEKKEVDAKIIGSGGAGSMEIQKAVLAKELVKAAVSLMQAGKWSEAEMQLMKAKNENPDEPLVYYNMAIVKLKQSQSKEALAEIEMAFKKGFKDFRALEADVDLKSLRSKPEFAALVSRYVQK